MFIQRYYHKKITEFNKIIKDYCENNNIKVSFESFLFHNKNEYCSPAFYHIHLCPKIYLVNSKIFQDYYNSLDKDFQQDIITEKEIIENKQLLRQNKELLKMLKKYQKEDSIL